jgi:hypothetical protein
MAFDRYQVNANLNKNNTNEDIVNGFGFFFN